MSRELNQLIAARSDAIKNMQAFITQAGGKPMDADLKAKFENAKAAFEDLNVQATALRAAEETAKDSSFLLPNADSKHASFQNYLRVGRVDNMTTGAGSAGAAVPTDLEAAIVKKLYDAVLMRRLGTVMNMGASSEKIPVDGSAGTVYWTAEGASYTASDPTITSVTLAANKLTALVKVSEELLKDAAFDVEGYVVEQIANLEAKEEESKFLVGASGGSYPVGVSVGADAGVTAASTTAFTYAELMTLYFALKSGYRANGTFLVSDTAMQKIMQLTDGANQYVFQPSYNAAEPDRLLGRPIYASSQLPAVAAAAVPVLFGDMKYYRIGDWQGTTIQRLNELYSETGLIGFRVYSRLDGKLTLSEAVKKLTMKAS